ncbi:MAG TPA: VacJ family lipoprotein [Candidatus Binatia bacterium]|nr:VacJ family lipoprotein [Candidatus Binatia bacterium]
MKTPGTRRFAAMILPMLAALAIAAPARAQSLPTGIPPPAAAGAAPSEPGSPADVDPWEPFNRAIFEFNDGLDHYVLRPVAEGWDTVLPDPVERSLDNFFDNLRFPIRFVNNILQAKVDPAAITLCRFLVNSTFGVAGFLDVASHLDLPAQTGDFGQTLGVWGIPGGPYLVLPVLGPSNPRDTVGIAADSYINIGGFFIDWYYLLGARVVETVNTRALLLEDVDRAREASLDFYVAVRSAYLARRRALIEGRAEPTPEEEKELYFPDYSEQSVLP